MGEFAPPPEYPTPLLSVWDRDWQGWRASSVGFLPCPRPAGCCQQSGCVAAAREDTETAGQRRLAARERPWPQVCLVLPARGVQRILKYVSVFFKSRDSTHVRTHTRMYVCVCMYIWCAFCNIRRRDNIWSVVLGGACSPHFSTDHTLPYGLYWSLLAIGAVFWAPSDE